MKKARGTNTADDDRWRWKDVKQKRASGEVSKPLVDEASGVGRHPWHHLDQGSPDVEGSKKRLTMNGQAEGFRLECKRPPLDLPLVTKAPSHEKAKPSNRASLSARSARKTLHVSCCRGV